MTTTLYSREPAIIKVVDQPMAFRGMYHNIRYYEAEDGQLHCLLGCDHFAYKNVAQLQHAVRKWETHNDDD